MRLVFLGSGRFAVASLEALVEARHHVAAVVTQPDRESGRGRAVCPPPVKPVAQSLGLPVLQPPRIKSPDALAALAHLAPDVQVVVAYGQILPAPVLAIPPLGTINVHASLLPLYRGAAPVQWAIANGERETGVTAMLLDEGLDTGPILLRRSLQIGAEETSEQLEARLSPLGADLLLQTLAELAGGRLRPVPQDHQRATLAPRLRKEDGRVDWRLPAQALERRVRAFQPWPGATTVFGSRALQVRRARVEEGCSGEPGIVLLADRDGILVGCGGGSCLRLIEVQPESRRVMSAAAFAAGARVEPGMRLG